MRFATPIPLALVLVQVASLVACSAEDTHENLTVSSTGDATAATTEAPGQSVDDDNTATSSEPDSTTTGAVPSGPTGEFWHEALRAHIYVPEAVHSGPARVMFIFQGGGDPQNLPYQGMRQWWAPTWEAENIIAVAPAAGAPYPWAFPFGFNGRAGSLDDVDRVEALMDVLRDAYALDEDRVYAVGWTDGSAMTIQLGLWMDDLFAAIIGIDLGWYCGDYTACGARTGSRQVPMYLGYAIGSAFGDPFVPNAATFYQQAGHDIELVDFAGSHNDAWAALIGTDPAAVWAWLDARRR